MREMRESSRMRKMRESSRMRWWSKMRGRVGEVG